MPLTAPPPEESVLLHNISWETYERLLDDNVSRATRFAYDEGELEIMVVSAGHEGPNHALVYIAGIVAEVTGRDFQNYGTTTFRRKDLAKGFEPDCCFYIRDAPGMRGKKEIDLATDPPPELIIEVDITRSSLNRFRIFAAVGVEEIWRYQAERVQFYRLEGESYREIKESVALSPMTASQATLFVEQRERETWSAWLNSIRDWVRARL